MSKETKAAVLTAVATDKIEVIQSEMLELAKVYQTRIAFTDMNPVNKSREAVIMGLFESVIDGLSAMKEVNSLTDEQLESIIGERTGLNLKEFSIKAHETLSKKLQEGR